METKEKERPKRTLQTDDGVEYDPFQVPSYREDAWREINERRKKASLGSAFAVASRVVAKALAMQKEFPLHPLSRVYEKGVERTVADEALALIVESRYHVTMEQQEPGAFLFLFDFGKPPAPAQEDSEEEEEDRVRNPSK